MKIYIITDTHFGHSKMSLYCNRPDGYELLILKNIKKIKDIDILIHLGDICWGDDEAWLKKLKVVCPLSKIWLVRGNHDKKSDSWYLHNGFDFISKIIHMKRFGKNIVFSHKPLSDFGYDINIHGHFHNNDHRRIEPELQAVANDKHVLVMMEHEYRPFSLEELCKRI